MSREISPEDAHSIAPEPEGDSAPARGVVGSEPAALTGTPAPPDAAAIHAVMAGIMLAMFLSALEQTIVAPALPAIGKSLGDFDDLSWIVTSYLLAATAATPLFGKLTDIHGRRTIMLVAIGIFIVGSLVCGLAPTIWVLVVGRALQGIGGGGLIPIAQTIIADLLTPRERPMAQSYTSIVFMSASILGPVLGGLLTDHLHWSFIFWINLPLGAVALVMTERALRHLPRHDRPHRLDIPGVALMVAASVALLLALDWGGVKYSWLSWPIVGLIAASAVLWALFGGRLLTANEPFIPLAILRGRVTSTITGAAFFSIGTIIAVSIYVPLYCQAVLGASASMSGLALIGFTFGATIGSLVTGRLIAQLTRYMRVAAVGLLIAIGIFAYLAAAASGLSLATFSLLLTVLGAAIGPMYPTSTIVMQNAVKPYQMGTATGTLNFFRLLGGAVIVAVFGALVFGGAGGAATPVERADLAARYDMTFIAGAVFLAISLACVIAVEELPLHGPLRRTDAGEGPATRGA